VDADNIRRDEGGDDVPAPPKPKVARGRILDEVLEIEASLRSRLEESTEAGEASRLERRTKARPQRRAPARLTWLEGQLELREEAIRRRVPRWSPGGSLPPEEALIMAFDEIVSENAREANAAAIARQQAREAHGKGVELGALGAVLILGLFASGVALVYSLWDGFFG
jgi:hypothetical protein